jgi:hypothetical protein
LAGLVLFPRFANGEDGVEAVKARGRAAGLPEFEVAESLHFRAVGDAPEKHRQDALSVCEAVASEYFKHFTARKFEIAWPRDRMTLVVLASSKSYAAFEGGIAEEAVGGHFDLEKNRLVTFDFRRGARDLASVPEQDNTLALVHELFHLLTFNTGVLSLTGDVPLCISEGLATYGETWRPRHRGEVGATNERRLLELRGSLTKGPGWIPLERLFTTDAVFEDEATQHQAYPQAWKLVHKLMRDPARLPRFRDYLAALREKPEPGKRLEIAEKHLGEFEKLDREYRR